MASDSEMPKVGNHSHHEQPSNSIPLLHFKMDEMKKEMSKVNRTLDEIREENQQNRLWRRDIENKTNNQQNRIDEDYKQLHEHVTAVDTRTTHEALDKRYSHDVHDKRYVKLSDIKLVLFGISLSAGAVGALVAKLTSIFGGH